MRKYLCGFSFIKFFEQCKLKIILIWRRKFSNFWPMPFKNSFVYGKRKSCRCEAEVVSECFLGLLCSRKKVLRWRKKRIVFIFLMNTKRVSHLFLSISVIFLVGWEAGIFAYKVRSFDFLSCILCREI